MNEDECARLEAEEINAEEAYFNARPEINTPDRRRVFDAGFFRGYKSACPKHPLRLTS